MNYTLSTQVIWNIRMLIYYGQFSGFAVSLNLVYIFLNLSFVHATAIYFSTRVIYSNHARILVLSTIENV